MLFLGEMIEVWIYYDKDIPIPSSEILARIGSEALSSIVLLRWAVIYIRRYMVDKSMAHVSMGKILISKGQ